ncbi:Murein DD-endopeptidase MepM and murein hydrolase activator NlpD, containing LysM domain [Cyclonatronum proteinivorum]|uniref:Murein DD-endopeptidase MepM and murein hydrolase activator NlpD, containing LysM domain n=1 Tax=Cyclonatronum proteinivorum TaxID=1457365 RepID=A0A345UP24_9BACT|nr:peptidoglycan DD-metalloendopeptidase family protein [Cyclonatronum proteinivorum]AXJ02226.1 Murein DD-endopeptidase MepM and murein hydrolase activator NlpD, containing LysM domain [Cyclonatronum proteinivorum]
MHALISVRALSFTFILSSVMLLSCFPEAKQPLPEEIQVTTELASLPAEPIRMDSFGLPEELFEVTERRVRNGETLSAMLAPFGLGSQRVHEIVQASQDVFNVRRINSGRPVHFYVNPETEELSFFVYESSNREYVVFDLSDEVSVHVSSREITRKTRHISGEINGSLYVSLTEQGGSPALVSALAQVYAWQVDFYRIQRGDSFTVVYEQLYIDDEPVGIGRIKTAHMNHRGTDYYAVFFDQGDTGHGTYFDLEGNSLQKAFLRAPLDYTRISSRFTNRRYHPILQRNMPHHGTDYAAPVGTPIRAVGDGVITHAAFDRNNGNYIRIRHNSVYETGYLHMSRMAAGMRRGTTVRQGQVIGYVGATGLATGPHLCFRFWQNGQPVDPYRVEMPPSEPVEPRYRFQFTAAKHAALVQLFPEKHLHGPQLHLAAADLLQHPAALQSLVLVQ